MMRRMLISIAMGAALMTASTGAKAQVDLSAYADPEGFLDIQALTCAQLAGTWQDQADLLSVGTAVGTTASQSGITWTSGRAGKPSTS
jgi:hypothetical protein